MITVLLVDDEILEIEKLKNHVHWMELGAQVIGTAENGKQGLEMVEVHKPDIVITDIKMPVMDGIMMSREIMNIYPATCIIYLSGHDEFDYAKEAITIKVSDYLLKPVYIKEFEKKMREYITLCEIKKIKTNKLINESMNLLNSYLNYDFLYNDLIVSGKNRIYEYISTFIEIINSAVTDPIILHSIVNAIAYKITGVIKIKINPNLYPQEDVHSFLLYMIDLVKEKMFTDQIFNHKIIDHIKKYINEHYYENISIEKIAVATNLSASYMRSFFKKYVGCTVWDYLKQVRMEKAAEFLDELYKVKDVTTKCGYDNVSYFCKVFQSYYGVTPGDYRINLNKGKNV